MLVNWIDLEKRNLRRLNFKGKGWDREGEGGGQKRQQDHVMANLVVLWGWYVVSLAIVPTIILALDYCSLLALQSNGYMAFSVHCPRKESNFGAKLHSCPFPFMASFLH